MRPMKLGPLSGHSASPGAPGWARSGPAWVPWRPRGSDGLCFSRFRLLCHERRARVPAVLGLGPGPAGVLQAVSGGVPRGADDDHLPVPVRLLHPGWSRRERRLKRISGCAFCFCFRDSMQGHPHFYAVLFRGLSSEPVRLPRQAPLQLLVVQK